MLLKCLIHMYVCTYYVVLKMTSIECILLENTFGLNRVHHQLEPTNQAIVLKSKWVEIISKKHFILIFMEMQSKLKSKVEISQNFVAFSEYINFNGKIPKIW